MNTKRPGSRDGFLPGALTNPHSLLLLGEWGLMIYWILQRETAPKNQQGESI